MNFSRFDIAILIVMPLAIISMSFVFPALGLTDVSTSENDIPDYNVSADRFDFSGDFPDDPTQASVDTNVTGPLNQTEGETVDIWNGTNSTFNATVTDVNSTNNTVSFKIDSTDGDPIYPQVEEGNRDKVFDLLGTTVWVEVHNITSNSSAEVEYKVSRSGEDSNWLEELPYVGTLIGGFGDMAKVVGWLTEVIYWFLATIFDITLNTISMLVGITGYFINLIAWLSTTYAQVISSAQSFVSLFVAIPGILLSAELAKIIIVGINLLPTT